MSDGIRLFLIFLAAINPPAIALSTPALSSAVRRRAVALALVVAGVPLTPDGTTPATAIIVAVTEANPLGSTPMHMVSVAGERVSG